MLIIWSSLSSSFSILLPYLPKYLDKLTPYNTSLKFEQVLLKPVSVSEYCWISGNSVVDPYEICIVFAWVCLSKYWV